MFSFDASIVLKDRALGEQAQRLQDRLYLNQSGQTVTVTTGRDVVKGGKEFLLVQGCKSRWLAETSVASKSQFRSSSRSKLKRA